MISTLLTVVTIMAAIVLIFVGSRNINNLMDIRPDYANVERDGQLERVDPDEVELGSIIVVQPGEKVPIDGMIIEGSSSLNTSALTGESLPREAEVGDEVISGLGCLDLSSIDIFGNLCRCRRYDPCGAECDSLFVCKKIVRKKKASCSLNGAGSWHYSYTFVKFMKFLKKINNFLHALQNNSADDCRLGKFQELLFLQ